MLHYLKRFKSPQCFKAAIQLNLPWFKLVVHIERPSGLREARCQNVILASSQVKVFIVALKGKTGRQSEKPAVTEAGEA